MGPVLDSIADVILCQSSYISCIHLLELINLLGISPIISQLNAEVLESQEQLTKMGSVDSANVNGGAGTKKHILLNAFDMSTVGHLSPGQWKVEPYFVLHVCS